VSRIERGTVILPHRDRLMHLASVLGLPIVELLARSGWSGADSVFNEQRPQLESSVLPAQFYLDVRLRPLPQYSTPIVETSQLRDAIARARATTARARSVLEQCEQTRARYEQPWGSRIERTSSSPAVPASGDGDRHNGVTQ
jgi:hypothetical protein